MADFLSAISVLLVFLTFLLTIIEKEVSDTCSRRKPEIEQKQSRIQFNTELRKLLFLKIGPVTLIYCITFYSLLPKTVHIIITSSFNLWNFNELNTIFIFIEMGLLGLTIYSISKLVQVINKISE